MTATVLSIARNIINQIGNEWSSRIPSPKWVEVRQATNDMLDAFVSDLIAHLEAEQATHIAELEAKLQSCYLQAALDHRAMASQKAERDSLAAVIEKVRKAFDEYTGYAEICSAVRDILAAAPSDILADLKADVWDEGTSIGVRSILLNSPQLPPNPYRRTEQGEQ